MRQRVLQQQQQPRDGTGRPQASIGALAGDDAHDQRPRHRGSTQCQGDARHAPEGDGDGPHADGQQDRGRGGAVGFVALVVAVLQPRVGHEHRAVVVDVAGLGHHRPEGESPAREKPAAIHGGPQRGTGDRREVRFGEVASLVGIPPLGLERIDHLVVRGHELDVAGAQHDGAQAGSRAARGLDADPVDEHRDALAGRVAHHRHDHGLRHRAADQSDLRMLDRWIYSPGHAGAAKQGDHAGVVQGCGVELVLAQDRQRARRRRGAGIARRHRDGSRAGHGLSRRGA